MARARCTSNRANGRALWLVAVEIRQYEYLFIQALSYTVRTSFRFPVLSWAATKGWNMRKLSLALAALATIAVAAPTTASAKEFGVGVRVGGDHFRDRGAFRDRALLRTSSPVAGVACSIRPRQFHNVFGTHYLGH